MLFPPHFWECMRSLLGLWVLRGRAGRAKSCSTHRQGAATSVVVSGSSSAARRPGTMWLSKRKDVLQQGVWEAG